MYIARLKRLIAFCLLILTHSSFAQTLSLNFGVAADYDFFLRNKQITTNKGRAGLLGSPQLIGGLRFHTQQNFDLMLDGTIGISRIDMPTELKGNNRLIYEQARSLITIGSGLHIELENEQVFMPFIQLGTAFYDFRGITEKTSAGSFSTAADYDTRHWEIVCGGGVEYVFRALGINALNFRVLYTPKDIFPQPVKYDLMGQNNTGKYALQGKLLQLLFSYEIAIPIIRQQRSY
ncbi:MAG: hypothetical protein JST82_11745 [Bacteroidetes bacterium]|nr:hypothetical protein [Bacteroidota bacterium]